MIPLGVFDDTSLLLGEDPLKHAFMRRFDFISPFRVMDPQGLPRYTIYGVSVHEVSPDTPPRTAGVAVPTVSQYSYFGDGMTEAYLPLPPQERLW